MSGTSNTEANNTEANKAVVVDFWRAFSASHFDDALALLAEDATWWVSGTTDISGTYSKSAFAELASGIAQDTENGIQVTPTLLTAEDDRVAMEATSYGLLKNGTIYQNTWIRNTSPRFLAARLRRRIHQLTNLEGI